MKTFRNVTIALGLLLLLYVGAYWAFARKEMRDGYLSSGRAYSSDFEWDDWQKLFVPIAFLEYRMDVERPFRKRHVGHWQAADSDDFVTLARDGECSFRIGDFHGAGKMDMKHTKEYGMEFVQEGDAYRFQFYAGGESGKATAEVSVDTRTPEDIFSDFHILSEATLTRADAPD